MVPLLVLNEVCRKSILESTDGQSKADPLHIVNPLPVTLHLYVTMSVGHTQAVVFMSCPDPISM